MLGGGDDSRIERMHAPPPQLCRQELAAQAFSIYERASPLAAELTRAEGGPSWLTTTQEEDEDAPDDKARPNSPAAVMELTSPTWPIMFTYRLLKSDRAQRLIWG